MSVTSFTMRKSLLRFALLECDSYLRRYYTYATGLPSRMICTRYYQPLLAACKTWALQNCRDFSPHEQMFLS